MLIWLIAVGFYCGMLTYVLFLAVRGDWRTAREIDEFWIEEVYKQTET